MKTQRTVHPDNRLDINNWWRYIYAEEGRMATGKRPQQLKHGKKQGLLQQEGRGE